IRRLFEPRQGKSHACNLAVAAARGELMIWTDDDVLVDPDWIATYSEAAARWPDAGYFGGTIQLWFECAPPQWFLDNKYLEAMVAARDLGPEERYLSETENPFGANMAIRTELLKENSFDPNLGPRENNNIRGEESALIGTLRSRGIRGVWVPGARLQHFVVKRRLTRAYLWEFYRGAGRTEARLYPTLEVGKRWGGVPRWLLRGAVEAWLAAGWKRLWSRSQWVPAYTRAAFCFGMIAEARHAARNGRPAQPGRSPEPRGQRERTTAVS
ncbi:MAG TPA: glycosyltransferase, partial [Isosphaeraceae bacterium]|nr:glycosyltransferase [Isosphaeraceae bacterium]